MDTMETVQGAFVMAGAGLLLFPRRAPRPRRALRALMAFTSAALVPLAWDQRLPSPVEGLALAAWVLAGVALLMGLGNDRR